MRSTTWTENLFVTTKKSETVMSKKPTPKKKVTKATIKQRKALKVALENGGNVSGAMKEVGYSPAMAKNPQKLKESEGWKDLMKKAGLDDKSLLKKSKQHLEARQFHQMMVDPLITDREVEEVLEEAGGKFLKAVIVEVTYTTKKGEEKTFEKKNVFYTMPDNLAQDRALDKLFKIRGAYSGDGGNSTIVPIQINNMLGSKRESYGI